jgi:type VI protein secretion system component Hcp
MTTIINPAQPCERNNQTEELTEIELSKVNGGSQTTGAGAGNRTFNPFHITKKIDTASPKLF